MRGKKRKPPIKKLPQGRKRTAYDWALIETEYVLGIIAEDGTHYMPSERDLAERHGPSRSAVHKRSVKGGWDAKRGLEATKVAAEMLDASRHVLVQQAAVINKQLGSHAVGLMAEIGQHLRRVELLRQLYSDRIEKLKAAGQDTHDERKKLAMLVIDAGDIARLAGAMRELQKVVMLGAGEPTDNLKLEGLDGLAAAIAGIKARPL